MHTTTPFASTAGSNPAPAPWQRLLWLTLLVAASLVFSLGFACATPFVAFAVAASVTLGRRDALLLVLAVWLANQLVGYGMLGYPWDANTLAWGGVMAIATVGATVAARRTGGSAVAFGQPLAAAAGFVAAYAAYEGLLFLAALGLGGTSAFAPAILAQVLAINVAALAGLFVLNRLGAAIGFLPGFLAGPVHAAGAARTA